MEAKMEWIQEHRRQLMAGFAALAVIALIIGLCLSWFVQNESLSTVGAVKAPSTLKLMGPNQTTIEQIDLRYDKKRDVDESGRVTLRKPFCVTSDKANTGYALFLAHTTNINGLSIKLYRATAKNNPSSVDATAYVAGLDNRGKPFAWNKGGSDLMTTSEGSYLNKDNDGKADTEHDPQTFDKALGLNDLERSASPLYWKLPNQNTGDNAVNNYIIELSWQETQKETDVIYLIAVGE